MLTTGEMLQAVSVTIFSMSLLISVRAYAYNFKSSRVTQTERLHEVWWTSEMMATRAEVFEICRGLARDGKELAAFVAYYESPLTTPEPPGRPAFAKLAGFFCNLEVCLEAGVVDERLACKLFGEAHYADYQPLIARLREGVLACETTNGKLPTWLQMTLDLERRFLRCGVVFEPMPPLAVNTAYISKR